ncbi:MAG: hypothetical protein WCG81_09905 [Candidatus Angelobacter sp.]
MTKVAQMISVKIYGGVVSTLIVSFVFQNEQILRPGRVESKVGDCIPGGCENRIVEFAFKVLSVFSKHYLVARTA